LSKRAKAEALLVVVTFIWGCSFVVVKAGLRDASPLAFLAVRCTLAGLLLLVVMGRGSKNRPALGPSLVLGIFLFGGFAFQTSGQFYTTPAKCAFITGFSVILVPLILWVSGGRLRSASFAGAGLGLAGIYLLVLPSGLESVNRGDLLTLVAAVFFALHIVLVGSYTRRHSFLRLVPGQVLTVGLFAAAALPLDGAGMLRWTPGLLLAFAYTSVFATGFAFSVQNWAQQYTPPAHTALIFALEPVFAAFASRVAIGERLGGKVLVGSALILAGMLVSEIWGGSVPSPVEG